MKFNSNILLLILSFSPFLLKAQTDSFPASWTGTWKGDLEIFNGAGKVQTVAMQVDIAPLDTSKEGRYRFGLVYGAMEKTSVLTSWYP